MKNKFKKLLALPIIAITMSSCVFVKYNETSGYTRVKHHNGENLTVGGKLFTSAWMQRSAEYKALCLQAYNIAKLRIDNELRLRHSMPRAIITDIDETILDNSPNAVHQALKGKDYEDQSWDKWCDLAQADALEGAVELFQYAAKNGIEIFYISNRNERNRQGTLENLKKHNFPYADNEHLLLREKSSDKTSRRQKIEEKYKVVLYMGDNLGDFTHEYDSSSEADRYNALLKDKNEFGDRFIVLPNPNYGTWEKAMNGGYPDLKTKDKKLKKELLKTHK